MYKSSKVLLLIFFITISISCDEEKGKVVVKIGNENIYQSQIDSMITDELYQLRKEALKSYISKTLFEKEAKTRTLSTSELRELEIIQKAKKVNQADIDEYTMINNIEDFDYKQVKKALTNINRRFRFEVFIDSLKTAYNVKIIDNSSNPKMNAVDNLYSHSKNNNHYKVKLYFVADYNCPSCQNHYERILELCDSYNGKVQFNFVPYSSDLENEKVFFAEALAMQDKYWKLNGYLFQVNRLTDSIISNLIQLYSIDSSRLMLDYSNHINYIKVESNRKILENLKIYSVPTLIIDDIIIPGYTNSEELLQIINYKLLNI